MDNLIAAAAAQGKLHADMTPETDRTTVADEEVPRPSRKILNFVPFTHASYQRLLVREQTEKERDKERKERSQEAHLKDGELKFGLDEDELEKRPDRNPDLEEGTTLKAEYGEPPAYYMGLPLEEIDPGITSKTFVVLQRWLHHINIARFSATPSFFVLPAWNPLRRFAVYLCTNQVFDFFILFTILTNCVCLAIPAVSQLDWLELVFFGIYSCEMEIKMVARGLFIGKYTYLRDPWNWLDLIVIVSGIASFPLHTEATQAIASTGTSTSATQALRTFRVLRAVKTISIFPGLRTIVNAMLRAIKMLLEVVMMTLFCLLVFSLVSVQIYRGTLRQKCVMDPRRLEDKKLSFESYDTFYRRMLHDSENWAQDSEGDYILCGNATGAGYCPTHHLCQTDIGENPDYGFMNFDNIFWSALISFQLMTIDFWENAYRKVLLTNGALTVIFFIMVVFFGSFYLMNLMLAVVAITYQEEAEKTSREIESEKSSKKKRREAAATFYNMSKMATKQGAWAKMIQVNKQKEKIKDTESPLEKLVHLRKTINNWKKAKMKREMEVAPECVVHFEPYSCSQRSAFVIAQNTKYFGRKWHEIAHSNSRLKKSHAHWQKIREAVRERNPALMSGFNVDAVPGGSALADPRRPSAKHRGSETARVTIVTEPTTSRTKMPTPSRPTSPPTGRQNKNASCLAEERDPEDTARGVPQSDSQVEDHDTDQYSPSFAAQVERLATRTERKLSAQSASSSRLEQQSRRGKKGFGNANRNAAEPRVGAKREVGFGMIGASLSSLLKTTHFLGQRGAEREPEISDSDEDTDRDWEGDTNQNADNKNSPPQDQRGSLKQTVTPTHTEVNKAGTSQQGQGGGQEDLNPVQSSNTDSFKPLPLQSVIVPGERRSSKEPSASFGERQGKASIPNTEQNPSLVPGQNVSPVPKVEQGRREHQQSLGSIYSNSLSTARRSMGVPADPGPHTSLTLPHGHPHAERHENEIRLGNMIDLASSCNRSGFLMSTDPTQAMQLSNKFLLTDVVLDAAKGIIHPPPPKPRKKRGWFSSCCAAISPCCRGSEKQRCPEFRRRLSLWWCKTRDLIHGTVVDIFFDLFINACIVINTIIMTSEHHGMPEYLGDVIKIGSVIFTSLFALEAFLKILGMGVRGYFSSRWNRFDFTIALVSTISVILERQNIKGTQFLRAFRLLRVLKLAQVWPAMNSLLMIIGSALGALGQLTCILLIILYIFAIIGLHLFKEKYTIVNFPGGVPRWNFNDFFHSFMMMFRVLCGEWIEPLWDCMRIAEVYDSVCMLVFFPTLIFGNFIVLNLFLALLLNAFGDDDKIKKEDSRGARRLREAKKRFKDKFRWLFNCFCCKKKVNLIIHRPLNDTGEENVFTTIEATIERKSPDKKQSVAPSTWNTANPGFSLTSYELPTYRAEQDRRRGRGGISMDLMEMKKKMTKGCLLMEEEPPPCLPHWVLFHLSQAREIFNASTYGRTWMRFRMAVMRLTDSDAFEYLILFLIIASSLTLAVEDYDYQLTKDDDPMKLVTNVCNHVFTILFVIEMVLRWMAYGVTRYFTSVWTIIDFVVVVVSMTTIVSPQESINDFNQFRAFLALRALRPLRVVSRIQGMKIVVNSLMRAIPAILNVFMVSLVFWLIFVVMGVQFFAGKFFKCIDKESGEKVDVQDKAECEKNDDYYWFNSYINFDNAGNGFLALFQVATFEGWMEIMRDSVDSTDVDIQPEFENSLYTYLYFVAFILCGSFFSLNLVIGVIIDNFNVLKKKYEGSYLDAFLTLNQRNYYNTLKKLSQRKPQKIITPPKYRFQKVFYELSVSDRFELILMGVVFLNMVLVGIEFYQYKITCLWREVMFCCEVAFTTFFNLEALLKIIGLRQHYFTRPWNVYDFTVAFFSLINVAVHSYSMLREEQAINAVGGDGNIGETNYGTSGDGLVSVEGSILFPPTLLRLLRIFRISRVLRIIKVAKGLRKVMFSLVISLPATLNIMALLLLCLFIYAIFGMFLFHNIKLTGALTPHLNFRNIKNSALLLLSLSTAAGWNDVLDPMLIQPPFCNNTHHLVPGRGWLATVNGDCGNAWTAIPFMVSYIIITYLFIINMYIAVILENYQQAHQQEEVGVTEDDFEMFYSVWQRYDPYATQFIPYSLLSDFVADLDPPLGIDKPNEIALVSINLPILQGDRVHCLDILLALVKNVLADIEESEEMFQLKKQINAKFIARFPSRARMRVISTTIQRKKEDVAARTLQRAWQVFKTQQAIYSIMKLSVKDKADGGSNQHNVSTVEELQQNVALAYAKYTQRIFLKYSDSHSQSSEMMRKVPYRK